MNVLECSDILSIMYAIYGKRLIEYFSLEKVISFTLNLCNKHNLDINLRDILRWIDVTIKLNCNILDHLPLIFTDRNTSLIPIQNEVMSYKLF